MSDEFDHYLFAYFTSQTEAEGEQVRLARSRGTSPLYWEQLSGGEPYLRSTVGRRGVRDPFLVRAAGLPGERAAFYLIATDLRAYGSDEASFWPEVQRRGSRSIVVWDSVDLVSWSEPRLVEVAPPEAGNAWAPEATFDENAGCYFVYWASKLYRAGSDRSEDEYNRILCASTYDFRVFSEAEPWVDPGRSVIDATVARSGDQFFRFIKDERTPDSTTPAAKYITLECSRSLRSTSWEMVGEGIGGPPDGEPVSGNALVHGEGPIVVHSEADDRWYLFIDEFGLRRYVPFESPVIDSDEWHMCGDFQLPPGASHGSILPISLEEWHRFDHTRQKGAK